MQSNPFTPDERALWKRREKILPSEWAEQNRVLAVGQSNRPGPWRNDNAPYGRGIMNLAVAPGVTQINIMKSGQIGMSEIVRNLIGYFADYDPDPMGLALPDKIKGESIVTERVHPLFTDTPCLAKLMTGAKRDMTKSKIRLTNAFILHLVWAGSDSATASDPMRRTFNDEVDKKGFRSWGGAQPDPVGRMATRMKTYGERALQMNLSTPTTRNGVIFRLFDGSNFQLFYYAPCPHCGKFQRLIFDQLIKDVPKRKRKETLADYSARIKSRGVKYQCLECGKKIDERDKNAMVRRGIWRTADGEIEDAEKVKEWPAGTSLGMQISALYALWESWADIVAQFIEAGRDPDKLFTFRVETLGEPWEEQETKTHFGMYSDKCERATLDEGVVPEWAICLIATVDTQHNHFYYVIRAWAAGLKSQRILHGTVLTFADLDKLFFKTQFANEKEGVLAMQPKLILIDTGGTRLSGEAMSRTQQVYRWAWQRRARVRATKGASTRRAGIHYWPTRVNREGEQKHKRSPKQELWFVDSHYYKDLMTAHIQAAGDEEIWLLNKRDDEEYNAQMACMHKVTDPKTLLGIWTQRQMGARHDFHDCEHLQFAAADMLNMNLMPSAEQLRTKPKPKPKPRVKRDPFKPMPLKL